MVDNISGGADTIDSNTIDLKTSILSVGSLNANGITTSNLYANGAATDFAFFITTTLPVPIGGSIVIIIPADFTLNSATVIGIIYFIIIYYFVL
jgi:hypothetical protein